MSSAHVVQTQPSFDSVPSAAHLPHLTRSNHDTLLYATQSGRDRPYLGPTSPSKAGSDSQIGSDDFSQAGVESRLDARKAFHTVQTEGTSLLLDTGLKVLSSNTETIALPLNRETDVLFSNTERKVLPLDLESEAVSSNTKRKAVDAARKAIPLDTEKRKASPLDTVKRKALPLDTGRQALPLDTGREDAATVGTRLKRDGFLLFAYNVTASDLLPVDRQVPDTRPQGCPREMPEVSSVGPVSVVICTHNEAASVLRRTVFSVLRHTPPDLLRDVIVVDDNSTIGDPARALEAIGQEVTQGRLRLLKTDGRQGLVRARLQGAEAARGKVLVFLDSHCECGPDWLPPLLHALKDDKRKIVSPYIDVIRSESFAYARSPDNLQGAFNWRLEFGWRSIPLDDVAARAGPHLPISTPVISGGLFAVDRQFFFDIGAYDDDMDIWGGENMELSFRVWMCGGRLEIVPCSRVGHVFRTSIPYSFPGERRHTVLRNLARAATVWMDDYSDIFFAAVNMTSRQDVGDVTSRRALRERLRCRSFEWYLRTVSSHLTVPSPSTLQYGQFKNRGSLLCLTVTWGDAGGTLPAASVTAVEELRLVACHGADNQTVELLTTGDLRMHERCVSPGGNKRLTLDPCPQHSGRWVFKDGRVTLNGTDLCMTSVDNEFVRLQTYSHGNPFQLWEPSYTFQWS